MKATISKDLLLQAVAAAASVVESKGENPVLRNVRIELGDGTLIASGSHLIEEVTFTTAAEIAESGAIGVNAKDIVDRVKAMPGGAIALSQDGERLVLQSGKRKHVLPTIAADLFPEFGAPKERLFELSAPALVTALGRVRHCIDTDSTRPALNGARVEFGDLFLSAAGTNGKSLGFTKVPIGAGRKYSPIVLPLRAIGTILRLLAEADTVMVGVDGPWFWVRNDSMLYGAKLFEATFPQFEYAAQESMRPRKSRVNRAALADACKSAALAGKDPQKPGLLRFDFAPGVIGISATGGGAAASDQIDADYDGPEMSVGLYAENVLAAAGTFEDEEILVCFGVAGNTFNPVTFIPVDRDDNVQIVMPARLD